MANKIEIGINQRIPISLLEMALLATLEGQGTPEYFAELASTEYQGENRIRKSTYVMGRLTNRNPLMPFLHFCGFYNCYYTGIDRKPQCNLFMKKDRHLRCLPLTLPIYAGSVLPVCHISIWQNCC